MNKSINNGFDQILKDRFTHSSSDIVYDAISSLWHMDDECEELISKIASKVVIGLFCLEYLSHLNEIIKEKAGIKNNVTAKDLTNSGIICGIKDKLKTKGDMGRQVKDVIASLTELLESSDIKNLDELTKIAHASDYLLSSLEDMKGVSKDDYTLWLYSIPHYYKKDLHDTAGSKKKPQNKKQSSIHRKNLRSKKTAEKQSL